MDKLIDIVYNISRLPSYTSVNLEHYTTAKTLADVERVFRSIPRSELLKLKYTVTPYCARKMNQIRRNKIDMLENSND